MILFYLVVLFPFFLSANTLQIELSAESAILMNADTGVILYEKNPHKKLFPASITKIATATYALKLQEPLDQMISASQECIGSVTEEAKQKTNYGLPSYWLVTDASHMGIKKGEILSLKDLMFGMMVASADDASNVIAYTLGKGSISAFMDGLNLYLQKIGCQNTFFNNPHGLHHPKHVTTAHDMAILTQEALKHPLFREMVATKRYTRPRTNKQDSTVLVQGNRLLRPGEFFYPKAIGIKTGRTSKAGNTFVAAAKEGNRTLIAVLLNVKERKDIFREAIHLFEAAFNQPKMERVLIKAGPQKHTLILESTHQPLNTYVEKDVVMSYYPAEEPQTRAFLSWDPIQLPILKGNKVGEIHLYQDKTIVQIAPLYAESDVYPPFLYHLRQKIFNKENKFFVWIGSMIVLGALFYLGLFRN